MGMGTNGQVLARSRESKRNSVIYGFAGALFALIGVRFFLTADAWYLYLGAGIIVVVAAMFAARAITSLGTDEHSASE